MGAMDHRSDFPTVLQSFTTYLRNTLQVLGTGRKTDTESALTEPTAPGPMTRTLQSLRHRGALTVHQTGQSKPAARILSRCPCGTSVGLAQTGSCSVLQTNTRRVKEAKCIPQSDTGNKGRISNSCLFIGEGKQAKTGNLAPCVEQPAQVSPCHGLRA